MDDTKKLIEKYKRELMELSAKQKKTPKIIGYVEGDNNFLSGLQADIIEESESENSAKVIEKSGAVSGGSSFENRTDMRGDPETVFERSDNKNAVTDAADSGMDSGDSGNFDVVFERSDSSENFDAPDKNSRVSDPENRTDPNGAVTEIIDEYEPESPQKNLNDPQNRPPKCNSEDPEGFGSPDVIFERPNSEKTEKKGDINNEIIDGSRPGSPQKSSGSSENRVPGYTEISSTQQVRSDITNNSEPQNNVIENKVSGVTDNSLPIPGFDSAETIRTTPEQAERLNDQPVSGTSPDEQLTGRSFEGASERPDIDVSMEQGSRAEPIEYPEKNFTNFEEFERVNTGRGSLIFRVYTGREAVVIEGAECVITKKIGSETRTIARLVTNESGQTPVQELPAPPKELSQHSENTIQPFALYDAEVTKPGFIRVVLKDIPVFDGVQSVQRVFMIIE